MDKHFSVEATSFTKPRKASKAMLTSALVITLGLTTIVILGAYYVFHLHRVGYAENVTLRPELQDAEATKVAGTEALSLLLRQSSTEVTKSASISRGLTRMGGWDDGTMGRWGLTRSTRETLRCLRRRLRNYPK